MRYRSYGPAFRPLKSAAPRNGNGCRQWTKGAKSRAFRRRGGGYATSVLDLVLPGLLDVGDHVRGHRDVVQLLSGLAAVLVSPGEELQGLGGRGLILGLLVHQNPGSS